MKSNKTANKVANKVERPVQYFTDEYLEWCKSVTVEQTLEFLENFQNLHDTSNRQNTKSKLISIKIPEDLLDTFKFQAQRLGIPYQTQIKNLMKAWLKDQS